MKYQFLHYLKSNNFTEVERVNSLLVKAFLKFNKLTVKNNILLLKYSMQNFNQSNYFLDSCLEQEGTLSLERLTQLFEYVISPADRIVSGAVYTPKIIRHKILTDNFAAIERDKAELNMIRIADICCGCGGFLMDAAQLLHEKTGKTFYDIYRSNIFGIDIQSYAIQRTKILLSLLALLNGEDSDFQFNLLQKDTLEFSNKDWKPKYKNFDLIVGNPPYVCSRNLSSQILSKIKSYKVCRSGHPDLYIPFFTIAIDMLKESGRLGFITMNSFFRSINGRLIRDYFSQKSLSIKIVDFRGYQIFESKNTYTCLFYVNKKVKSEFIEYAVCKDLSDLNNCKFSSIPYEKLDGYNGWSLNNYDIAHKLESSGIRIQDYCQSRHGIATLSNAVYIFKPVDEDSLFFYLKTKENLYPIEKKICRDIVNPNKLNSVNNLSLIQEKVIFPYAVDSGHASVYSPEKMMRDYPKTYSYLKSNLKILEKRDKGNTENYPQWYPFGRTQSLIMPRYKLFFPKIANKPIRCILCDSSELMFYNGLAFVSSDKRKLEILKKILESELFWQYVKNNSKPYSSGYFSLTGVDIKNFCIPNFSYEEENELLTISDIKVCERWLRCRYGGSVLC